MVNWCLPQQTSDYYVPLKNGSKILVSVHRLVDVTLLTLVQGSSPLRGAADIYPCNGDVAALPWAVTAP